ncbi:hypothetical protein BH10BAC3_BH10BAC3_39390 [soil metagenome]
MLYANPFKSLRETPGISQRQLAAFIGGDRTQLVRTENSMRNLSGNAILQLVKMVSLLLMMKGRVVTYSLVLSVQGLRAIAM